MGRGIENMKSNHFGVPTPEIWRCNVHEIDEQNKLRLRLFKPYVKKERLWITFTSVLFCDMPRSWAGAEFEIAPPDECLQLIRTLRNERLKLIPDDALINEYKLFKVRVETANLTSKDVLILAGDAYLETKDK
jgi:hypothetical protein